ncbi:porin [Vibrio sp. 99-8-1]|uniref:porin n=1 Tax=Vibrio sp. 99-8-1 TaxID=2607602 RepID=UPI00149366A9|nr:porin [Vibrio sp. 99-8-1]NOI66313.1 porin [Vibrio sp. 99-8-1]
MKKTLIALSVLVAAGSVNAAEIYNKDGNTFNFGGKLDVQYKKSLTPDADPKLQADDAEFNFEVIRQVNDNVKVLGYWEFDGIDSNAKKEKNLGNAYAGFDTNFGKLTFGIQDTVMDGAGVGNDMEFGTNAKVDDAGLSSENLAMYSYDQGMFFMAASTILDGNDDTSFVDGKIGVRPTEGLELRLFALDATTAAEAATYKQDPDSSTSSIIEDSAAKAETDYGVYAIQAQYAFDNFDIEASYADGSSQEKGEKKFDKKIMAISGAYNMGDFQFNLGYSTTDDEKLEKDYANYYANVLYTVAPSSIVYFEVGGNTGYYDTTTKKQGNQGADSKDYEVGYVAGIQVKF